MQRRRWAVRLSPIVAACALVSCTSDDTSPEAAPSSSSQVTSGSDLSSGEQTGSPGEPSDSASESSSEPPDKTTEPSQSPTEPEPDSDPREITAVMSGDVLLHEGLWETARIDATRTGRGSMDFRPLFAPMRPVVSAADVAICHMETPVAPKGGPFYGYPSFSSPPAVLPALEKTGFDVCTTASNHSIDQGFEGLTRTIDGLEAADLEHTGTYATKADSREPLIMEVDGVKVGLISQTYGTNGIPLPEGKPWSVPIIDPDEIKQLAAKAKDQGAEIVMVALHWGLEYTHEPSYDQVAVAEELAESPDINLIFGHHAHVVQPYDKVGGTWVVYGLGNAVAQQDTAVEGVYDGNTARVTFTERPNGSFRVSLLEYIPTMITRFDGSSPMRWLNVSRALEDPRYTGLRDLLAATHDRVSAAVNLENAFARGVVEGE